MEVKLAVLADAANLSQEGKLNITGIFDSINADELPFQLPHFVVVLRVLAHQSEVGSHKLTIRLADEDGKELTRVEGQFEVPKPKPAGMPIKAQIMLGVSNLAFPEAGSYVFDILIDDRYEESIPVHVVRA